MKRRGFFKSIAKAAAIIALAPQIAFRVRPELPRFMPFEQEALKQYQKSWAYSFFYGRATSYEEYIHSFNRLPDLLPEVFQRD